MRDYTYRKLDVKYEDFDFTRQLFITTRYSMTSEIDCENLYLFSKENGFSFFNLCIAAIYKTIESIPELKQCFIEEEAREYEHINIIVPLIKEDHTVESVCIESIHDFDSFKEWNDFLQTVKDNPKDYEHIHSPETEDSMFATLSCIPWVHFSNLNDMVLDSDKFCPTIHWGKYENGKIPVSLTVNHIFVYGYHLGLFFNRLTDYMQNPHSIFANIK